MIHTPAGRRQALLLLLGCLAIAAAFTVTGMISYRRYVRQYRASVERQLAAIAELKVDGLEQWRRERLGDAAALAENESLAELVRRFLAAPGDAGTRGRLAGWLAPFRHHDQYDRIALFDATGVERLVALGAPEPPEPHLVGDIRDLRAAAGPVFLDFHRDGNGSIHLGILVPIREPGGGGTPIAALLLRIDPGRHLYPALARWPGASLTAETLLARREGEEVVFLSPLRYRPDAALRLRLPLSRADLPAAAAAGGRAGHFEGRDYRGEPVIAHLRAVPGSPWHLVARMDVAELYAPLRERLRVTLAVLAGLLLATAGGGALLWRRRTLRHYRERLEAERERAWLQDVLARSLDEIYVFDAGTLRFTFANRSAARNLGYTLEELQSLTPLDVKPRLDAAGFARLIEPLRSGEAPVLVFETAHRRKDGSEYPVEVHLQLVDSARGPVFLAVIADITVRARMEARLHLNEARLQSILEIAERRYAGEQELLDRALEKALTLTGSAIGYVYLYDEETQRFTLNSWSPGVMAACAVAEPQTVYELDGTGIWGEAVRQRQPILVNDYAAPNPLKRGCPGGHLVLRNFLTLPVFSGYEIVAVVGVANKEGDYDGTDCLQLSLLMDSVWRLVERNRAETELRERNAELERFIYTVSHDLKSPVVTLKSFLAYLERDLAQGDGERVAGDLRYLATATEKMASLLDDLLQLSRVGRVAGTPTTAGFEEVAAEAIALVAGAISARGVEVRLLPSPLRLRGDRARLVEIWQNLLENAVKFMGDQAAPRIEVGVSGEGKDAVFRVSDNGIGIDPRYQERIFTLFERLDPAVEGTGLGLALVKRIVEIHGGTIRAESAGPGRGATFLFTLPAAVLPPAGSAS